MGFPGGYTDVLLPKLVINILSFLGLLHTFIHTMMGFVGLSGLLEPATQFPPQPDLVLTQPESASAALIREMLPAERVHTGPGRAQAQGCAVCLDEYEDGEEIRRMRNCKHMFHKSCVDRWIDHDRRTCPLCREPFVPKELEHDFNQKIWATSGIPELYADYTNITHFL